MKPAKSENEDGLGTVHNKAIRTSRLRAFEIHDDLSNPFGCRNNFLFF